ncbi:MAG: cytochrome c3 family protein [Bacteroidetes bacterium]|nr:cytochrome c3 family protein [Bacteroidota bacterium]
MTKHKWMLWGMLFAICTPFALIASDETREAPLRFEENKHCFQCHSQKFYTYENEVTGKTDRKAMNPNFVYSPEAFYEGVHRNFACTDCHSPDYETFPHQAELRFEEMYQCLDCHGGDPTYAKYNFEVVEEEFHKSVHSTRHSEDFNCWMCHNPHSYKRMTAGDHSISEIVKYHNQTCMGCHADSYNFQRISDDVKPSLQNIHSFLPNFELHFSSVRCIECHTSKLDTLWVKHNILPKEEAVRNCVECHSTNTLLMGSLYKYQNLASRKERGFLNSVILNEAYVIGANTNKFMNLGSYIIFGLTLLGIIIHTIFRLKK